MGILFEIVRHLSDSEHYGKMLEAAERGEYALQLAVQAGHTDICFSEERIEFPVIEGGYLYRTLLTLASNKYQSTEEFFENRNSWAGVNIVGESVWYFTHAINTTQFLVKFEPSGLIHYQQMNYVKGVLQLCPYPNLLVNVKRDILAKVVDQVLHEVFGFGRIDNRTFHAIMSELVPTLIYASEELVKGDYRQQTEWNQSKFYTIRQYDQTWLGIPFGDRLIAYPTQPGAELSPITIHDQRGISNEQIFAKLLVVPPHMWDTCSGAAHLLKTIRTMLLMRRADETLDSIVRLAQVHSKL